MSYYLAIQRQIEARLALLIWQVYSIEVESFVSVSRDRGTRTTAGLFRSADGALYRFAKRPAGLEVERQQQG